MKNKRKEIIADTFVFRLRPQHWMIAKFQCKFNRDHSKERIFEDNETKIAYYIFRINKEQINFLLEDVEINWEEYRKAMELKDKQLA